MGSFSRPLIVDGAAHGSERGRHGAEIGALHGREVLLFGIAAILHALLGQPERKGQGEIAVTVFADDVLDAAAFVAARAFEYHAVLGSNVTLSRSGLLLRRMSRTSQPSPLSMTSHFCMMGT